MYSYFGNGSARQGKVVAEIVLVLDTLIEFIVPREIRIVFLKHFVIVHFIPRPFWDSIP